MSKRQSYVVGKMIVIKLFEKKIGFHTAVDIVVYDNHYYHRFLPTCHKTAYPLILHVCELDKIIFPHKSFNSQNINPSECVNRNKLNTPGNLIQVTSEVKVSLLINFDSYTLIKLSLYHCNI